MQVIYSLESGHTDTVTIDEKITSILTINWVSNMVKGAPKNDQIHKFLFPFFLQYLNCYFGIILVIKQSYDLKLGIRLTSGLKFIVTFQTSVNKINLVISFSCPCVI